MINFNKYLFAIAFVSSLCLTLPILSSAHAQEAKSNAQRKTLVDHVLDWSLKNAGYDPSSSHAENAKRFGKDWMNPFASRQQIEADIAQILESVKGGPAKVEGILADPNLTQPERTVSLRATLGNTKICPHCQRRFLIDFLFCPYDRTSLAFKAFPASLQVAVTGKGVLSLIELGNKFQSSDSITFRKAYASLKDTDEWYLIAGELELVDLSQIKMYGIRQGDNAISLGQARNRDWCYDGLRPNLGKRIIVGIKSFGTGSFGQQRAWARKMASKGYLNKDARFLNIYPYFIHGLKRKNRADNEKKYDPDSFESAVQRSGLLGGNKEALVDPDTLPKGMLSMIIMTPITAVFSIGTATLEVKIEGPVVRSIDKPNMPTANPVTVEFQDIPQGTYTVTAKYRGRELVRKIHVEKFTQVLDMIMH